MNLLAEVAPEAVGIPSQAVLDTVRELNALDYMNAIILMRHGQIFHQCCWAPFDTGRPHALWSLSKSFTSCAIGIARKEGLLQLEDRLIDFFPEYASIVTDPRMNCMTLQDLLTMRSGHASCAVPLMYPDETGSWIHGFLRSKLDFDPGTHFAYNSGASYMLSAVITRLTGLTLRDYLTPRLFAPLGITPGIWESSPEGINFGGWGLYLSTRDTARFAQLLLQGGQDDGRELIPHDYLAEAVKAQADNSMNERPDWKCGYGYQFWRSRYGFRGDGACGQYAVVVPEADLAVAVNACMPEMGRILDVLWERLLPALHDAPLAADPAGEQALAEYSRTLAIPTVQGDLQQRRAPVRYCFEPNAAKLTVCSVEFGPCDCALTFEGPNGSEQLRAGFGFFAGSTLRLQDRMAHPVAASAAWQPDGKLQIDVFFRDSTFRDRYMLDFTAPRQPLVWSTQCSLFRPLLPALPVRKNG